MLGLPLDYPRINQFPEWFVAEAGKTYEVRNIQQHTGKVYTGKELQEGISLAIIPDEPTWLTVHEIIDN